MVSLSRLPLRFERNQGQAADGIHFIGRHADYRVWLKLNEVLIQPGPDSNSDSLIQMRFLNARKQTRLSGREPAISSTSYFLGRDKAAWMSQIPEYKEVVYEQIYSGIDAVFYGTPDQIEFDFLLSPGVDPETIQLAFSGAREIELAPDGSLRFNGPAGNMRLTPPVAFQDSPEGRLPIACNFNLDEHSGIVSLSAGAFDPALPLTIDPILESSTYLGGGQTDIATAVITDESGHIYVAGITDSVNFPTSIGALAGTKNSGQDLFIMKFQPDARTLVYSTYLGGSAEDLPIDLEVDGTGRLVLVGQTASEDFPVQNAFQTEFAGGDTDAFLTVLGANGSSLVRSTFLGGSKVDAANALYLNDGVAHMAGFTSSTDFPLQGSFQSEYAGGQSDAFIAAFNLQDGGLRYSTYLGGNRTDSGRDIVVDPSGSIFVVGVTDSGDFPTVAAFQEEKDGSTDAFVAQFSSEGDELTFSSFLGGSSADLAIGIVLAPEEKIYVAGETQSSDFPVLNGLQTRIGGSSDFFLTCIQLPEYTLVQSTFLGGSSSESLRDLAIDAHHNIFLVGLSNSINFPQIGPLFGKNEGSDAVISKISRDGTVLIFSSFLGGDRGDTINRVALSPETIILVAGGTESLDFPVQNSFQSQSGAKGLYKSVNGGSMWTALEDAFAPAVSTLAIAPSSPQRLYAGTDSIGVFKSTDGGATWTPTESELAAFALTIHPQDPEIVYAGAFGSVLKTEDGGESWTALTEGLPPFTGFQTLAIDPLNPETVYAGSNGRGIFKTTDGGETWRAVNNGLDDAGKQIFDIAVNPTDSSRLFIGTLGSVYLSSNAGNLWEVTSFTGVGQVAAVALDPANPDAVYASGISSLGDIVGRTDDGGVTWRAFPLDGEVTDLAVNPGSPATIFAATSNRGVLKSTDGENWEEANQGLGSHQVSELALRTGSSATLFAATAGGTDAFIARIDPQNSFYFPQIADGRSGLRLKFQSTVFLLNTGNQATVQIDFFDSLGQPLELTLGDLGVGSSFEVTLEKGELLSAQTPGQGQIKTGYARVQAPPEVQGTVVFTRSDVIANKILYEAGFLAASSSTQFVFLLDSLGFRETGLALVHPRSSLMQDAEVALSLFDEDANPIDKVTVNLAPGEHSARFVDEIFTEIAEQVREMRGFILVESTRPVVATTLRQKDDPALEFPAEIANLTAFPVIPLNSLHNVLFVAQVGDGIFQNSRFQTTFILVNTGPFTQLATLEFFNSRGEEMELTLNGVGTASSFQVPLSSRGFSVFETSGDEGLRVGYARLSSNSLAVDGTALFRESDLDQGRSLFETGVGTATPRKSFSVILDSRGKQDTGLAMVNSSTESEAEITLRLYTKDFQLLAEESLNLKPGAHLARFVFQLFPEVMEAEEMEGVVVVDSTVPIAAVTLRQLNDPFVEFPVEVPLLTTFPVIPFSVR